MAAIMSVGIVRYLVACDVSHQTRKTFMHWFRYEADLSWSCRPLGEYDPNIEYIEYYKYMHITCSCAQILPFVNTYELDKAWARGTFR